MKIEFGANENYVSTSLPSLIPWGIHEVEFAGAEFVTITTETYTSKSLHFRFANKVGRYTEFLTAPRKGDEVRKTIITPKGEEKEMPSRLESFTMLLGHLLTAVAPEVLPLLSGKSFDFETLAKLIEKETKSSIGIKTKIKLITNGFGINRFPCILAVTEKGGKAVVVNNCIGEHLMFTEYELRQKREERNRFAD